MSRNARKRKNQESFLLNTSLVSNGSVFTDEEEDASSHSISHDPSSERRNSGIAPTKLKRSGDQWLLNVALSSDLNSPSTSGIQNGHHSPLDTSALNLRESYPAPAGKRSTASPGNGPQRVQRPQRNARKFCTIFRDDDSDDLDDELDEMDYNDDGRDEDDWDSHSYASSTSSRSKRRRRTDGAQLYAGSKTSRTASASSGMLSADATCLSGVSRSSLAWACRDGTSESAAANNEYQLADVRRVFQRHQIACPWCSSSFKSPKNLHKHINSFHHDIDLYLCFQCQSGFWNQYDFDDHACRKAQSDLTPPIWDQLFVFAYCTSCTDEVFFSLETCVKLSNCLRDDYNVLDSYRLVTVWVDTSEKPKEDCIIPSSVKVSFLNWSKSVPTKCHICGMEVGRFSMDIDRFFSHFASHSGEKTFVCSECPTGFDHPAPASFSDALLYHEHLANGPHTDEYIEPSLKSLLYSIPIKAHDSDINLNDVVVCDLCGNDFPVGDWNKHDCAVSYTRRLLVGGRKVVKCPAVPVKPNRVDLSTSKRLKTDIKRYYIATMILDLSEIREKACLFSDLFSAKEAKQFKYEFLKDNQYQICHCEVFQQGQLCELCHQDFDWMSQYKAHLCECQRVNGTRKTMEMLRKDGTLRRTDKIVNGRVVPANADETLTTIRGLASVESQPAVPTSEDLAQREVISKCDWCKLSVFNLSQHKEYDCKKRPNASYDDYKKRKQEKNILDRILDPAANLQGYRLNTYRKGGISNNSSTTSATKNATPTTARKLLDTARSVANSAQSLLNPSTLRPNTSSSSTFNGLPTLHPIQLYNQPPIHGMDQGSYCFQRLPPAAIPSCLPSTYAGVFTHTTTQPGGAWTAPSNKEGPVYLIYGSAAEGVLNMGNLRVPAVTSTPATLPQMASSARGPVLVLAPPAEGAGEDTVPGRPTLRDPLANLSVGPSSASFQAANGFGPGAASLSIAATARQTAARETVAEKGPGMAGKSTTCPVCKEPYLGVAVLKQHLRQKHLFLCQRCSFCFVAKHQLSAHLESDRACALPPYPPEQCSYVCYLCPAHRAEDSAIKYYQHLVDCHSNHVTFHDKTGQVFPKCKIIKSELTNAPAGGYSLLSALPHTSDVSLTLSITPGTSQSAELYNQQASTQDSAADSHAALNNSISAVEFLENPDAMPSASSSPFCGAVSPADDNDILVLDSHQDQSPASDFGAGEDWGVGAAELLSGVGGSQNTLPAQSTGRICADDVVLQNGGVAADADEGNLDSVPSLDRIVKRTLTRLVHRVVNELKRESGDNAGDLMDLTEIDDGEIECLDPDNFGGAGSENGEGSPLEMVSGDCTAEVGDGCSQTSGLAPAGELETASRTYLAHQKLVVEKQLSQMKCPLCPKRFETESNLLTHIMSHCRQHNQYCFVCQLQFPTVRKVREHLAGQHPGSGSAPIHVLVFVQRSGGERMFVELVPKDRYREFSLIQRNKPVITTINVLPVFDRDSGSADLQFRLMPASEIPAHVQDVSVVLPNGNTVSLVSRSFSAGAAAAPLLSANANSSSGISGFIIAPSTTVDSLVASDGPTTSLFSTDQQSSNYQMSLEPAVASGATAAGDGVSANTPAHPDECTSPRLSEFQNLNVNMPCSQIVEIPSTSALCSTTQPVQSDVSEAVVPEDTTTASEASTATIGEESSPDGHFAQQVVVTETSVQNAAPNPPLDVSSGSASSGAAEVMVLTVGADDNDDIVIIEIPRAIDQQPMQDPQLIGIPDEDDDDECVVMEEGLVDVPASAYKARAQRTVSMCTVCNTTFLTAKALAEHETSHENDTGGTCEDILSVPNQMDVWVCRVCCLAYGSLAMFNSHFNKHTAFLSCADCSALCFTKDQVKQHKEGHSSYLYCCSACFKAFKTEYLLHLHLAYAHKTTILWICKICSLASENIAKIQGHFGQKHIEIFSRVTKQTSRQDVISSEMACCPRQKLHYQPDPSQVLPATCMQLPVGDCAHRTFTGYTETLLSCQKCGTLIPASKFMLEDEHAKEQGQIKLNVIEDIRSEFGVVNPIVNPPMLSTGHTSTDSRIGNVVDAVARSIGGHMQTAVGVPNIYGNISVNNRPDQQYQQQQLSFLNQIPIGQLPQLPVVVGGELHQRPLGELLQQQPGSIVTPSSSATSALFGGASGNALSQHGAFQVGTGQQLQSYLLPPGLCLSGAQTINVASQRLANPAGTIFQAVLPSSLPHQGTSSVQSMSTPGRAGGGLTGVASSSSATGPVAPDRSRFMNSFQQHNEIVPISSATLSAANASQNSITQQQLQHIQLQQLRLQGLAGNRALVGMSGANQNCFNIDLSLSIQNVPQSNLVGTTMAAPFVGRQQIVTPGVPGPGSANSGSLTDESVNNTSSVYSGNTQLCMNPVVNSCQQQLATSQPSMFTSLALGQPTTTTAAAIGVTRTVVPIFGSSNPQLVPISRMAHQPNSSAPLNAVNGIPRNQASTSNSGLPSRPVAAASGSQPNEKSTPQTTGTVADGGTQGPITCPDCAQICPNHASFKVHMLKHLKDSKYFCLECGTPVSSENEARDHLVKTHRQKLIYELRCPVPGCREVFSTKEDYLKHDHASVAHLKCKLCRVNLFTPAAQTEHTLKHSISGSYSCIFCGTCCLRAKNLEVHEMIHSYDQWWLCRECGLCYKTKEKMEEHFRLDHQQQHPERGLDAHACTICDRNEVYGAGSVSVHMNEHHAVSAVKIKKKITFGKEHLAFVGLLDAVAINPAKPAAGATPGLPARCVPIPIMPKPTTNTGTPTASLPNTLRGQRFVISTVLPTPGVAPGSSSMQRGSAGINITHPPAVVMRAQNTPSDSSLAAAATSGTNRLPVWMCQLCKQLMTNRTQYSQHHKNHPYPAYWSLSQNWHPQGRLTADHRTMLKCALCLYETQLMTMIEHLTKYHDSTGMYPCRVCGEDLGSRLDRENHMASNHGNWSAAPSGIASNVTSVTGRSALHVRCLMCAGQYVNQKLLSSHIQSVHDLTQMAKTMQLCFCLVCGRNFDSYDSFRPHARSHPMLAGIPLTEWVSHFSVKLQLKSVAGQNVFTGFNCGGCDAFSDGDGCKMMQHIWVKHLNCNQEGSFLRWHRDDDLGNDGHVTANCLLCRFLEFMKM